MTAARQDVVVRLDDLVPYERNARTHGEEQRELLENSLLTYGWTRPIIVAEGVILAGHGITEAAKALRDAGKCPRDWPDASTAPAVDLSNLNEAERRAYIIADNEIASRSETDEAILRGELLDLQEMGTDLQSLGIEAVRLEDLLRPLSEASDGEGNDDGDAMPDEPSFAVTEPGEVWCLGKHRLVVGDPAEPSVVKLVLGDVLPHLMVTEVPHGGDVNRDEKDWSDWREAVALFAGDVAYLWHDGLFTGRVGNTLENAGLVLRAQIVWDMDRSVARGSDYPWQHTPCWYAARPKKKRKFGGRGQSTIWRIPEPERAEGDDRVRLPMECMKRCIDNSSSAGQAVYDPFAGTGTVLIAAERAGRACYAVESRPIQADVVIARWQQFTGFSATLDGDGRTYAEHRILRAIRG